MTVDGLGLAFPQQGWVVLDAIRNRGLTGSVMLGGSPAVRVFADQGDIYWAEAVGAPSIGARLVDAGAITAVQLERGAVRHEGIEHLERLFERVPAIDRDTVLVAARALAEQSLVGIASQMLAGVVVEPYTHHPSGMHLWNAQHPIARRNEVGRAAMWPPPRPAVTLPPVVANLAPPAVPVPVAPATPEAPRAVEVPEIPQVPTVIDPQQATEVSAVTEPPQATEEPAVTEVPGSAPMIVTAELDDFSLVWNDALTEPSSVETRAESRVETSVLWSARPAVATETRTDLAESTEPTIADEFEVRWPANSAEPDGSDRPDTLDAHPIERATNSFQVAVEEKAPAWTPSVGGDVVHPDQREPNQSLTEALSDLIVLVDRDLAAVRTDVDDLDDAGSELLSSDEFIAVRRAIASADTGLLNARRRLIDHRLRDRSSRGSSNGADDGPGNGLASGSSDGLHSAAVSGGVDHIGVAEGRDELDDLADGTPALRRIMGNLRRV